jgi:hypothetical protein
MADHLVEPYKRFRYNFHYWLKNFKYNEDGTFQFMINENTITGQGPTPAQPKTQAQIDASSKVPHTLKDPAPPIIVEPKGPSIVGLSEEP